mmetsp:Transcript_42828/g.67134  ORF Transcript_42828/g.67134 Transcript_42828/m.67134 type:complete len:678 (-) Transcript_42828:871-2904(-)|eukprot:CAMPEP_0184317558 /NCGR_PEP_ID=MMETSP1049-20130417/97348_1 /TAXON_ID=77928 /ORGANISM="Proteomonas sulcata, Strain CCMP704" /LENGTH=677 /DNA_ID=CAMNT_0026636985 /DNA_START=32 /DNA_END=2065 /DNA_ORIENTATION=-
MCTPGRQGAEGVRRRREGSSSEGMMHKKKTQLPSLYEQVTYSKAHQHSRKARQSHEFTNLSYRFGQVEEHTVPWIAAIITYFQYAMLFVFGGLRDALHNLSMLWKVFQQSGTENGYAKLLNDFQDFYTRRLYGRIHDVFNRPISSAPGAWIDVMEREFGNDYNDLRLTGNTITALNLSSYNYLGFAETDLEMRDEVVATMRRLGVSSTSPRSELGLSDAHTELEERVAEYIGKPAAMVFGMGFATNSTVIPALIGAGGLIVSDELNHSSIVTGARQSSSKIKVFKHNNPNSLEQTLRAAISEGQPRTGRPWKKILVVVEGLYSMEGEICKLKEIVAVCKKYKAYVYVDEAHSIGALGRTGKGVLEHCGVPPQDVDVMMGTFTKSFGSVGGYIAASKDVISYLKRVSPGSVYACSMSPACATQASLALRMISGEDGTNKGQEKIQRLRNNANLFRAGLQRMGCEVLGDEDSPVIPVMLYAASKIPAFSRECLKRNLAVVVVGFPATPLIKSRVRFCISAAHTEEDLIDALKLIDVIADRVMIKYKFSGRPNVAPTSVVQSQSKAHSMDVIGEWDAEHFTWNDSLVIEQNGRFARGNGDEGSWSVSSRANKTILSLDWDRWPTEELELQHLEEPCPSPRRHMFKGVGKMNMPHINTPLMCTFTLRPRSTSQTGATFKVL